jgi:hypothetical protein
MIGLVDERWAPISHDAVADILVDDPSVVPDWFGHDRKVVVHDLDETLRGHAFAKAGEALQVAEQHSHHPALAFGGRQIWVIDQPSTTRGSMYFPNVSLMRWLLRNCTTIRLKAAASCPISSVALTSID